MINSALTVHRKHHNNANNRLSIDEMQAQQCDDYAAIFDFISRISTCSSKRDAIEKVKEIFFIIFGAHRFKYWNSEYENDSLPEEINALMMNPEQAFYLSKEDNRFCIKVNWHEKFFGVVDVSDLNFPEYIEKYLKLALEIIAIGGVVFLNNEQYMEALKSEQNMRYTGTHDALTDLYNRAYVNEIFDHQIQEIPITVFMFDIDRLKFVNDNYGHAEGDKLIRNVASILRKCFRETDVVARIGGDEFVAILQEVDAKSAERFKKRIRLQIESHNNSRKDDHLEISFSIGYAIGGKPEDTIETVMKVADERMYKDKMRKRALLDRHFRNTQDTYFSGQRQLV